MRLLSAMVPVVLYHHERLTDSQFYLAAPDKSKEAGCVSRLASDYVIEPDALLEAVRAINVLFPTR